MNANLQIPNDPFNKIALSLSGGGYRAAAFHLGIISYLDRVTYKGKPLLEYVKMISTVSGGTITGVVYARLKSENKRFDDIYSFLFNALKDHDLVKEALQDMSSNSTWSGHKRKNLINAFAKLYDKYFTEGKKMEDLNVTNFHLEALVFNSTEFRNGLNFRFKKYKKSEYSGNFYLKVPTIVTSEVKLSDVIAASSCFPGGFEPINWPKDFQYDNAIKIDEYAQEKEEVGLMDGGIYDNQGIDSILMYKGADKNDHAYFDLVIVSDVSSPYIKEFEFTNDIEKIKFLPTNFNRLKRNLSYIIISYIFILLIVPFFWQYTNSILTGVCISLSFLGILLSFFYYLLKRNVKSSIKTFLDKPKNDSLKFYYEKLSYLNFGEISFRRILSLIKDRALSVSSLVGNVFMKVIRKHNYSNLYEDKRYQFRRISCLIKELTRDDFNRKNKDSKEKEDEIPHEETSKDLSGDYDKIIGKEIEKMVNDVSDFNTTLWFTDQNHNDDILKKLIATGQVTMCFNLLEYLLLICHTPNNGFEALEEEIKKEIQRVLKFAELDWSGFKKGPLFMVNDKHKSLILD